MPSATARPKPKRDVVVDPPNPDAIVRYYPNPLDIIRAYVESDFAEQLASEHERKVKLLADEGADVTDAASYKRVGERLVDVAIHQKEIEGWFAPIKDFAFKLHRMISGRENDVLQPLRSWTATAKDNRVRLEREEERRRRAEEQRLAEEARIAEQDRLTREAELLAANGEQDLADQVLEQAISTPAPVIVVASSLPQTKGVGSRANWKWRPIGGDTPQARARALQMVPREYLELSDKKLTAFAKAHEGTGRIPGIEFFDAGTVSVRS